MEYNTLITLNINFDFDLDGKCVSSQDVVSKHYRKSRVIVGKFYKMLSCNGIESCCHLDGRTAWIPRIEIRACIDSFQ